MAASRQRRNREQKNLHCWDHKVKTITHIRRLSAYCSEKSSARINDSVIITNPNPVSSHQHVTIIVRCVVTAG
jgi:ribosomal protein S17